MVTFLWGHKKTIAVCSELFGFLSTVFSAPASGKAPFSWSAADAHEIAHEESGGFQPEAQTSVDAYMATSGGFLVGGGGFGSLKSREIQHMIFHMGVNNVVFWKISKNIEPTLWKSRVTSKKTTQHLNFNISRKEPAGTTKIPPLSPSIFDAKNPSVSGVGFPDKINPTNFSHGL